MDLTIDVEDYKLNVRAAGVIIHNNKVLVHKKIRIRQRCRNDWICIDNREFL